MEGRARCRTPPRPDPVLAAKRDFIAKHNLVIWRFSDHWRLRKPDPLAKGLIDALGWSRFTAADDSSRPPSLGSGAARVSIPAVRSTRSPPEVKKKLNARGGIRVIGDPQIHVQTIAVLPGSTALQASLATLPGVDVLIAGEVREWETVEYARDIVTSGGPKGLILVGRVVSEDPGNEGVRRLDRIDRPRARPQPGFQRRRSLLEAALMRRFPQARSSTASRPTSARRGATPRTATPSSSVDRQRGDGHCDHGVLHDRCRPAGREDGPQHDHSARGHVLERSRRHGGHQPRT